MMCVEYFKTQVDSVRIGICTAAAVYRSGVNSALTIVMSGDW